MDQPRLNILATARQGTFLAWVPLVLACLVPAGCGEPGEIRVVHAQTGWAGGSPAPLPVNQSEDPRVGTVEAGLLLRTLDGEKRVLMVAAHPDDEDTAVLTTLARGLGARTAYLSLSRGEGGQNVIGGELGEGLGLVRTGELLSARSVDGAGQFFTRAFDFGYSKSAEETFQHWPEEELLADVVWVLRTFRPQVVLSVFSGTPRDGHGQHQAAGIVTRAAFEAAGDPARFPEQLGRGVEPWAPDKLYQLVRWSPESATLTFPLGTLDPLLGRSHFQVAMESRSRHRSQYFGAPRVPGPRRGGAELVSTRVPLPAGGDDGIFAGVDTTLTGLATSAGLPRNHALRRELEGYRSDIRAAGESLHAAHPERSTPHLVRALARVEAALALAQEAPEGPGRTALVRALESRRAGVGRALLATSLTVVDARMDRSTLIPGEGAAVEVMVWNGGPDPVRVQELELSLPPGWSLEGGQARTADGDDGNPMRAYFSPDPRTLASSPPSGDRPATVPPGELLRWTLRVTVPPDAAPSRPYFLREARDGSLYSWPEDRSLRGRPLDPPLLSARVTLDVAESVPFPVVRGVSHVGVDGVLGEYRVPVFVVPRVSVEVEPERMAWPAGDLGGREVTVRIRNLSRTEVTGTLELGTLPGWRVQEGHAVELEPGGEAVRRFSVTPDPGAGASDALTARFEAAFRGGGPDRGISYAETFALIDYPHLDPIPTLRPARLEVSRFPVQVREGLRVGYVMGSGDEGIRALRDLGVEVEALDAEALRGGDLSRFHTVVLGIRAYETRPDLAAANDAVLDFARRGGTVVVQYHRYEYPDGGFAPYPLSIRRPHDRVTDPDAPVTLLHPDHPLLRRPNRIGPDDFRGWVQERGLYHLNRWDDRYTPLLEMADPGEDPTRGALVVARVGEGAFIYTGLALFRQLPAGVPGGYRLLANLVSLRGSDLEGDR
jgi:LmbE family N-acetylglucosaminyl deacetylase